VNDNNVAAANDEVGLTEFAIESGIPIPSNSSGGRPIKYPWAKMRVGDSFFVAFANRHKTSLATIASVASKRLRPKRFIGRSCTCGGVQGLRVWRVE
jgi:hypothetical protein